MWLLQKDKRMGAWDVGTDDAWPGTALSSGHGHSPFLPPVQEAFGGCEAHVMHSGAAKAGQHAATLECGSFCTCKAEAAIVVAA